MRELYIDIYKDKKLIYSGDYQTDKSPNSVIAYFTHSPTSQMVIEGRTVTSYIINRNKQLIELQLLVDDDGTYIIDDLTTQFTKTVNARTFDYSSNDDTMLIQLPEGLTEEEKKDIYKIFETETNANAIIIDSEYSYEFGASGGWEKFFVSVGATYAVRLLDKIYDYFKNSPEKQALVKTVIITDKVKQYIADNNNIHKNNLILTDLVTENGEYIVTFKYKHKTFAVHLDDKLEVKEVLVT